MRNIRAELKSSGAACKKGRAVLGAHGKHSGSGLDCDPKGRRTSDDCSELPRGLQQLQSVPEMGQASSLRCPAQHTALPLFQPLQEVWLSCEISQHSGLGCRGSCCLRVFSSLKSLSRFALSTSSKQITANLCNSIESFLKECVFAF